MKNESSLQELQNSISQYSASISYKPLANEVDCNDVSFPLKIHANNLVLPQDKNSNPFEWAACCEKEFQNEKVFVLISGKKFDTFGTRHGKGTGWYDRFLSKLPPTWLKIGVADISHISKSKLVRQIWDQPMDWIVVKDGSDWRVYEMKIKVLK